MIWLRVSISVPILALSMLCVSQDLTSGGPDSIIAGPFGEPQMVMSEGGQWSYPIRVFANADIETFVPDITSPGWVQWHVQEFREKGTYYTYLYMYRRNTRSTIRELIYVDTRAKSVTVSRPLLKAFTVEISKAPLEVANSIAKITSLVTEETGRFRGQTIQESLLEQRRFNARMFMCSESDTPNPDCNLSDSDFQKKYPVSTIDPLRLIDGAQPGVNCGIGTNKSCSYYAPENLAASSPASPASPTALPTVDGIYHVGGGVSAPVPLNSVEAEFTDEARRAKYQGVCLVSMIIDAQGNPQSARVVRGLKMGLNEKALEAARKYRFKPAMLDGKTPVPVMITVEVNFRLY